MALSEEEVTRNVVEVAADYVGVDPGELDMDKKLRLEYGLSSVEASEIIMEMEDNYGIKVPVEEAVKILTARDAIEYIMKNA